MNGIYFFSTKIKNLSKNKMNLKNNKIEIIAK